MAALFIDELELFKTATATAITTKKKYFFLCQIMVTLQDLICKKVTLAGADPGCRPRGLPPHPKI